MDHLTQKLAAMAIIAALLFFPATNLLAVADPAEIPDSPAAPDDPDSAMFSLEDIFNRLDTGAAGTKRGNEFIEPQTGPESAGKNLDDVMAAAPAVDDTNGADVAEVLAGKTFWGLLPGVGWGLLNGTLEAQTPVNSTVEQEAGVYAAFNLSTVDPDLASANIKSGVTIFGVSGDANVVDTTAGTATAGDMLSGTIAYVQGAQVTGTLATQTPVNSTVNQQAGVYQAFNLSTVDPNLATANIRAGVSIFGVSGNANVVNTTSGTATAGDMKSGTIAYVQGSAVTGNATRTPVNSTVSQQAGFYEAFNLSTVDPDLATANIKSGVSIFGVPGNANVVDTSTGNATAGDMLFGKTAYVQGAAVTGTLATQTPDNSTVDQLAGVYEAFKLSTVDTDLTAENIKKDVNIFGVIGTLVAGGAGIPRTGQTKCYAANGNETACEQTGQDGDLQKGVAWPDPRFTDNGNGTVTDNLTGLVWLENTNCAGANRNWTTALSDITSLNTDGTINGNNCGDTSNNGSHQTDWRLPNILELLSQIDWSGSQPFANVNAYYWSSTTRADTRSNAWVVIMSTGLTSSWSKTDPFHRVWPVRAGQ